MTKAESVFSSVLCAAGFAAFLLAPALAVYVLGAFATWDLTWIADETMRAGRVTIGIVQVIWVLALSIAAS